MQVKIKCEVLLDDDSIRLIPLGDDFTRDTEHQFGIPRGDAVTDEKLHDIMISLARWISGRFMDQAKGTVVKARVI